MFETVGQVVKALKAYSDYYHAKSSSVIRFSTNRTTDVDADPFRRGFLDTITLRTELLTRLSMLDERQRTVLMLWYVSDLSAPEICERLALSRASAYRLRDRALQAMVDPVDVEEVVAAYA